MTHPGGYNQLLEGIAQNVGKGPKAELFDEQVRVLSLLGDVDRDDIYNLADVTIAECYDTYNDLVKQAKRKKCRSEIR